MTSVPEVAQAMGAVLGAGADQAGAETGLVQRRSKLTGSVFTQTLVFGWLADPDASLCALTQTAATLGTPISPPALFQRFTPRAAECLGRVLAAAVAEAIAAEPVAVPVLQRFNAVLVMDSSTIMLPDALGEIWTGCGGRGSFGQSALKLQVRLDLTTGRMLGPLLDQGRTPDSNSLAQSAPLPSGALRIADLGYYRLDTFREIGQQGGYFRSRYQAGTKLYLPDGTALDLVKLLSNPAATGIDRPVLLGGTHRLPVRLLAAKAPPEVSAQRRRFASGEKDQARKKQQQPSKARLPLCDWTIYVTNAPVALLNRDEALILGRARWQVELLFKLWKQHGGVDRWRSANPCRILCEVYAKLVAMVILHWTLLTAVWKYPDRSLVKAAVTVRRHAVMLAWAMTGLLSAAVVIEQIGPCLRAGCRIERRRQRPSAYQLLLALPDAA